MNVALVPVLLLLSASALSAAQPLPSAPQGTSSSYHEPGNNEYVRVVTEDEIRSIIEDLTGRKPGRRDVQYHLERAQKYGLDAEAFADDYKDLPEYRRLTPERITEEAFRELLGRTPSRKELRYYVDRQRTEGWTAGAVRHAILESDEYREKIADAYIDHAFADLLDREPTTEERRGYRRDVLRRGHDEDDIRRSLKEGTEYRVTIPNRKITSAFKEVLGREPDLAGCEPFRRLILERGWDEKQFAAHLRKSDEYKNRTQDIVRRIYLDLLGREPDPEGLENYRRALFERGWTEDDVRKNIRASDEYKNRQRGK